MRSVMIGFGFSLARRVLTLSALMGMPAAVGGCSGAGTTRTVDGSTDIGPPDQVADVAFDTPDVLDGDGCCSDETCASLMSDRNNRETCGHVCPGDFFCENGACGECNAGSTVCPPYGCYSLRNDSQHCGACTVQCGSGEGCEDGYCVAIPDAP